MKAGKFGFIDKTGKEVIPLKYENAEGFTNGLSQVSLNNKVGMINKKEKVIIPFKYDIIRNFINGKA